VSVAFAAEDKAQSLGHAARKLGIALLALESFDVRFPDARRDAAPGARAEDREALVQVAAELAWSLVVQREACGLVEPEYVRREFGIPDEVWRRLGAQPRRMPHAAGKPLRGAAAERRP
jgi:hypothetical protein